MKQIVGGTLTDDARQLRTNFVASQPAAWFAERYRADGLAGGHVIMLGPGNAEAARAALSAWPGGLQVGGGIDAAAAPGWIAAGAAKVIVTSWLFPDGVFARERLEALAKAIGRDRLVVDLSCRAVRQGGTTAYHVAIDRWQRLTAFPIDAEHLALVGKWCSELLVHAADVEGLCRGIEEELVERLGRWATVPTTYAGGANAISDLARVERLSAGRVDLTFGSALDLFGGTLVRYADCVAWNRRQGADATPPR